MSSPVHVVCPRCHRTNRLPAGRPAGAARCGSCREPLFSGHPVELTGESFDRHLAVEGLPLVVDFWAPWCGPCRMMAPAFVEAAARLEPRARLAKVDTQAEPGLAERFGIHAIPTLVAFRGGAEVARQSGALDLPRLLAWVEPLLG
jgi:thioredoxin 2